MNTHPKPSFDYEGISGPTIIGGERYLFQFPNGYGASVVRNNMSYGGCVGLFELAVTDANGLCYTTPITSDVIGRLTDSEVNSLLARIEALPTNMW